MMSGFATLAATILALFLGFLQLSGWLLLPLAAVSTLGMRHYDPENFRSWTGYLTSFITSLVALAVLAWLASIANHYVACNV